MSALQLRFKMMSPLRISGWRMIVQQGRIVGLGGGLVPREEEGGAGGE